MLSETALIEQFKLIYPRVFDVHTGDYSVTATVAAVAARQIVWKS